MVLGASNSGKSSLINALLKKNIAAVSKIANTTDDYHEAIITEDNI